MIRLTKAREFRSFIKKNPNILIQTHDYPDPDAIASAFGLFKLIKHFKGHSGIIYRGEISRAITMEMIDQLKIPIKHASEIDISPDQAIIVIDGRIENSNVSSHHGNYIAEIDHHPGARIRRNKIFMDVRPKYGSASSIIGEYYRYLKVPIEKNVATALTIGLNTDTLRLIREVSVNDIEIYAYLYKKSDRTFLEYILLNNIELGDLTFFKKAINRLTHKKRLGLMDLGSLNNTTLLAIVCDFILALKEIDVIMGMSNDKNRIALSVRSESKNLPADKVIQEITKGLGNGGGHKTMAAGAILIKDGDNLAKLKKIIRQRFFKLQKVIT